VDAVNLVDKMFGTSKKDGKQVVIF